MGRSSSYNYINYEGCAALNTLASVRYYAAPSGSQARIPYGFSYEKTVDIKKDGAKKYDLYRNDNPLPLAYTYEDSISEDTWKSWNKAEKREALLQYGERGN